MNTVIALCRLEAHPHGALWVVPCCPYCSQRHIHGGGGHDEDPRQLLSHRAAHCRVQDLPPGIDPSPGYVLQEFGTPGGFTTLAPQQGESASNSAPPNSADYSPDTPTRSGATERVCARQDEAQLDGPAGRDADREPRRSRGGTKPDEETKTMSMTLTDAKAALAKLSFSSLAWIYRKAQGDKPPVGTSKATLLETMTEMFEEKAKAENGPAMTEVSIECETWLGEVAGDGKPAPKKAEAAATPEPEKPTKSKQEKAIKLPKQPKPAKEPRERDPRLPAPGSVIKKVWRGETLEIEVGERDFGFRGERWKSLSAIASSLLKCPANGFLWAGLTEGAKAAQARREAKAAEKLAAEEAKANEQVTAKPEKKPKPAKRAKSKSSKKSKTKSK